MIGCVYMLIREKLVEKKQRVTEFEQRESLKLEFSRLRSRLVETDKGAKETKVTHRGNVKTNLIVSVNLLQLFAHLCQGLFKVLSFIPYFYHKRVKLNIQILTVSVILCSVNFTAEFSKFAGTLSAAFSQHHLLNLKQLS